MNGDFWEIHANILLETCTGPRVCSVHAVGNARTVTDFCDLHVIPHDKREIIVVCTKMKLYGGENDELFRAQKGLEKRIS